MQMKIHQDICESMPLAQHSQLTFWARIEFMWGASSTSSSSAAGECIRRRWPHAQARTPKKTTLTGPTARL